MTTAVQHGVLAGPGFLLQDKLPAPMAATVVVFGFLIAGQVLEQWGVAPLFATVVLGITGMAIVFAAIVWRHTEDEPAVEPATS